MKDVKNGETPFPLGVGGLILKSEKQAIKGQFVLIDNEKYYQIKNYDGMQPFFISLASDSNHWMYLASTGGLSAGRVNADNALFPYYTDDKITESFEITGSKTILHVTKNGHKYLWEPFSDRYQGIYMLERTISKSTIGNKIIFEERNLDLGFTFSYSWMNSEDFGWIKKSTITNENTEVADVYIVDGLQNVLPSGIDKGTQNGFSTLVDGYKKTELMSEANLALFRMEAILVDRAEPSESLRANTIWNFGLDNASFLLSSTQLKAVRSGQRVTPESEAKGVRGALFACAELKLETATSKSWYFVAEVNQDAAQVNNLIDFIQTTKNIAEVLEENIAKGTEALKAIVGQADGIQETADENNVARHFANTLFNTMRGGIYDDNYSIRSDFFSKHIKHFNKECWTKHSNFLSTLPETIDYSALEVLVQQQDDANLYRLFLEYLPLTFSRRHGDPSRPWNQFNINIKDDNGDKILSYQGNWRDIFQNWEALSLSYPEYINGIIAKFVNATTADGYNPYKITNDGIDWEVIEPENPWSNIGYWGDHQIIYLLKLMEVSQKHYPARLQALLNKDIFAFANVPYRLKTYKEIVANPKDSIRFDAKLHHDIEKLEESYGSDARLVLNANNEVILVNFTEKILATLLAKLSNFIPEAGIWMNTLRPEWNDANNALVGTGASMVTLYYMRRFVAFAQDLFGDSANESFSLTTEAHEFFMAINNSLRSHSSLLEKGFDNTQRKVVADELGGAGNDYRQKIYAGFSSNKELITKDELIEFFKLTLEYIDQSIEANKRADAMYHAYNLVSFSADKVEIRNLYEMLEGQVSVLSAGKLSANETLELLDSLRNSALYRPDQQSYILYPNKTLPSFVDKNRIPTNEVNKISLLVKLVADGNTSIITTDKKGEYHFNANFNNVSFLTAALNKLKASNAFDISDNEQAEIEALYERLFDHQSFTGRSGTFYKYEGLGCIYWHMVSKLLLVIGENISKAIAENADAEIIAELKAHYAEVKVGIGAHKAPEAYGSFPFDPYSHTPMMAGVQQPGMTGQVKEDVISRFFELGVNVANGQISIQSDMLQNTEFMAANSENKFPHLKFTYCSIPFEYQMDGTSGVDVCFADGKVEKSKNYQLNVSTSDLIFARDNSIQKIVVHFN